MKCTDYAVLGIVTCAWIASTAYLFLHPSDVNFATWAGLAATMGGIYHWLTIYDDKKQDIEHAE